MIVNEKLVDGEREMMVNEINFFISLSLQIYEIPEMAATKITAVTP